MHKDLLDDGLIDEQTYKKIDAITNRNVISLYYELRLVLYLGIVFLTGGVGYIVYENISSIGHVVIMSLMAVGIGVGFHFIDKKSKPYSNDQVKVEAIYFDYLLVLTGLLVISLFTYVQVYFELIDLLIRWTSLITGVLFLFLAYQYDNRMLLSLGITAMAAVLGLTITPIDWGSGQWLEGTDLYFLSFGYGITLLVVGLWLNMMHIKKHFTFTYHHFGWLLVYAGALAFMFDSNQGELVAFSMLLPLAAILYVNWREKSFLFFIYGYLCSYIVSTFLLLSLDLAYEFYVLYFPFSAIGSVVLMISKRKHFSDDQ